MWSLFVGKIKKKRDVLFGYSPAHYLADNIKQEYAKFKEVVRLS